MNAPVTPLASDLSRLTDAEPSVTAPQDRARAATRERVARHRAAKRQAAAIEFVRTDASLFLHPDRLSQKAGAPKHHLRRMAIKELVDNALDAAPSATLTEIDPDTFVITDDGPGLDPARVAELFSVTRPMMSTKLLRRPTRGAVGNGLRVATGAAFASGGQIAVESRGVRQVLGFDRATGETVVLERGASVIRTGTRIVVVFGAALPADSRATMWGNEAIALAGAAADPMLTHPNWYSEAAFDELRLAARGTAADLAALFGVDLRNARRKVREQAQPDSAERYIDPDGPAADLSLADLLARAPKQPKLNALPEDTVSATAYRIERITALVGGANVPAIVQVWATELSANATDMSIRLFVNRTPVVADLRLHLGGTAFVSGCGLDWSHIGSVSKVAYSVAIAITTPAIALISDGKTPDVSPFRAGLVDTIGPALRRAHQPKRRKKRSIKDVAFEVMEAAYLKASANDTLPANARQIMYAARPFILERTGAAKLTDDYFTQGLLPAFMDENPDLTAGWDVVYDARGHMVEPHTGHSVPLGTLRVREYLQRRAREDAGSLVAATGGLHETAGPGDRYGAVLFIEKEGFEPLLRAARIAERFDVAVMSTKGMSVVASRALVDRLSASGTKILVAHDLDIAGVRILGTLRSDSSRYSFSARPDVRRLGLTLAQAHDMGLAAERQEVKAKNPERMLAALGAYGATTDELRFLASGMRVELNAMTSDVLVGWIEQRLRDHGVAKLVPSAQLIELRAREVLGRLHMKDAVAKLDQEARQYAAKVDLPSDLADQIRRQFEEDPALPWEDALANALSATREETS
jgi:hypothetical protein